MPLAVIEGGEKGDETVLSRLRRLWASRTSVAYSQALPTEIYEESTPGSKELFFTRQTIADAFAKAAPAVVNITVSLGNTF
jgi:hypothetical protein